jgi:cobalt/nickel transport system ATP-binding protein
MESIMSDKIFEFNNVSFSYLGKYPALREIDIDISRGEKVMLIGANGSGKSTLLNMLDALIFPDKGIIKAYGKELTENIFNDEIFSKDFRKKVGLVFQDPNVQLFCPTVKEDIVFGPLNLGFSKTEIDARLERLISILDIKDLLERSPHQLSIGERRKVAIASTLIIEPEVLILDEPTAGLDPATTRHIIDILLNEHQAGKTLIVSTHDLHLVEEISGTVHVFSRDKKIVMTGNSEDILADSALLSANNLAHIHGHMHHGQIHVHPHEHLDHHPED